MPDPLQEVEAVSRDASRNCAEMRQKAKLGVDLHKRLHDTYLARLDVIENVTGADVGSFEDILSRLTGLEGRARRTESAFYPSEYLDGYEKARLSLIDRFTKLRDGRSPIGS